MSFFKVLNLFGGVCFIILAIAILLTEYQPSKWLIVIAFISCGIDSLQNAFKKE